MLYIRLCSSTFWMLMWRRLELWKKKCLCCLLRCCPSYLAPPQVEFCTCRCDDFIAFAIPCTTPPTQQQVTQPSSLAVISTQPIPQQRPIIQERKQQCKNCDVKCLNFLAAILILFLIVLLLFYLFLLLVEFEYIFYCVEDEWLMFATQEMIVRNYLKLFS